MEFYNINDSKIKEISYFDYYTMENDSSLFDFSRKYNINPNLLAALNGLDVNSTFIKKQMIMLPKNDYSYYITKSGDTLDNVVTIFDTEVNNILKDNQIIYLSEGQLLVHKSK